MGGKHPILCHTTIRLLKMMQTNRFIELLAKKKSGEISLLELRELSMIIDNNPEYAAFVKAMDTAYSSVLFHTDNKNKEKYLNRHWSNIKQKIEAPVLNIACYKNSRRRMLLLKVAAVAASIIIIAALSTYFLFPDKSTLNNPQIVSATTQKGSKSKIVLPDGTSVTLNADSKLSYSGDFNLKDRKVQLTGEAFFDVTHDACHPFIIHTNKADIKVIGTAFNVKNYSREDDFETSLIRGKIEVTLNDASHKKIQMAPSEKLIISNKKNSATGPVAELNNDVVTLTHISKEDNIVTETSWMQNRFVLIDRPLSEIAAALERQFNIKVNFKSDAAKNYNYRINVENSNPEEIMQILSLSRKINYTITKNNELVIE